MNARVRSLVLEYARTLGCDCTPSIALERIGREAAQLVVAHEETCALLARLEEAERGRA